jgi:hypothetical protein
MVNMKIIREAGVEGIGYEEGGDGSSGNSICALTIFLPILIYESGGDAIQRESFQRKFS